VPNAYDHAIQIHPLNEYGHADHVHRHECVNEYLHFHYGNADEYEYVHAYASVHGHADVYELFPRDDAHDYAYVCAGEYDHVYVRARHSLLTPFYTLIQL
jgi:hypothetical protein